MEKKVQFEFNEKKAIERVKDKVKEYNKEEIRECFYSFKSKNEEEKHRNVINPIDTDILKGSIFMGDTSIAEVVIAVPLLKGDKVQTLWNKISNEISDAIIKAYYE